MNARRDPSLSRSDRCGVARAERRECSSSARGAPNARVVWGRAEEQETDWAGGPGEGVAPPPVAAGGACRHRPANRCSWTRISRAERVSRVADCSLRAGDGPDGLSSCGRYDRAGAPAPPASLGSVRSRDWRGAGSSGRAAKIPGWRERSTRSRTRRAGSARPRRRSTSRRASPRRASERSSSTSIRRRTRPRGSGCARTGPRATTCSTLRSPSSRSRRRSRTSSSSKPSRGRREAARRDDGGRTRQALAAANGFGFVLSTARRRSDR